MDKFRREERQLNEFCTFFISQRRECEQLLSISTLEGTYQTIDNFVKNHPKVTDDLLNTCEICYRGKEIPYLAYVTQYRTFTEQMHFGSFVKPQYLISKPMRAAAFFIQKASDCLQTARYFTIKSALLLDTNENLPWSQGYIPHFWFRCIHFGTAATWMSNTYDQILQAVYWGEELFTDAKNHGKSYDASWDDEKTMKECNHNFVINTLKARGLTECEDNLNQCFSSIQEVRSWANFIKHKGGLDYKFLEAPPLGKSYFIPASDEDALRLIHSSTNVLPDSKYELVPFKSPVVIDIDEKKQTLVDAHETLLCCIKKVIHFFGFDSTAV